MPRRRVRTSEYDTPPTSPQVSPPLWQDSELPFDAQAKIRTPPPRRKKVNDELAELRRRAKTAGATARSRINLQIRCSVELYKALIGLAEEYHHPITEIARQCLEDGVRKYKDFSTPGLNPFGAIPLTRAYPSLVRAQTPTSLAGRLAPTHQGVREESTDEDVDVFNVEKYVEKLSTLPQSLLIPSAPPISETHRSQTAKVEDTGIFTETELFETV